MTDTSDITIIECSCGNFELHRNGRLFHVALSREEAERTVALIEAANSQPEETS